MLTLSLKKNKHWDFNHLIVKLELYFEKKSNFDLANYCFLIIILVCFTIRFGVTESMIAPFLEGFTLSEAIANNRVFYYRSRNTWRNRLPKRTSCKSHLITSAVSNFISSLGFSKSFVILFSLILIRKIKSINIKYLIVLM